MVLNIETRKNTTWTRIRTNNEKELTEKKLLIEKVRVEPGINSRDIYPANTTSANKIRTALLWLKMRYFLFGIKVAKNDEIKLPTRGKIINNERIIGFII